MVLCRITVCSLILPGLLYILPGAHAASVPDLLDKRAQLDRTVWAPEVLAQRYEQRFVRLWDAMRHGGSAQAYSILEKFSFRELVLPRPVAEHTLPMSITQRKFERGEMRWRHSRWLHWLAQQQSSGYQIRQSEWHHSRFTPGNNTRSARSEITFAIHVVGTTPAKRIILRGVLAVDWQSQNTGTLPQADAITVQSLEVLERQAADGFRHVAAVRGDAKQPRVMPLLVYDLDHDGLAEIMLGGLNQVAWNQGGFKFKVKRFLPHKQDIFDAAVVADFTGDGRADVVAVDALGYPLLFRANPKGELSEAGWRAAQIKLDLPKSFTAGDIDGDGDLDLFIASYKYPYGGGQMPTPYYDANDGFPAYLLENDGHGRFTDITARAGLAAKRKRRTYSSSFVDIDDDRDLDLVVVSDFAGVDVYQNDGRGVFTDITGQLQRARHFFGMGHTFGDYDRDGRLDLYVIGMSSTTARRLDRLRLGRPDRPQDNVLRQHMGYGNRMFLGGKRGLQPAPFNDSVARTGWSWGASSFDIDNDGYQDIFVANGHLSGKSARDYCSTFWRHDIYSEQDGSKEDPVRAALYKKIARAVNQGEMSWNGYEHKVMLWNQGGSGFINIAFLLGLAMEYDGRGVVASDLDNDGRVDLLVVEFPRKPDIHYTLHIYRNELQVPGNWVGVRLHDHPFGFASVGATVTVRTRQGKRIARVVNGDSFSSQHPATAHFGLGTLESIEAIEVRWLNGLRRIVSRPGINRYHTIVPELSELVTGE